MLAVRAAHMFDGTGLSAHPMVIIDGVQVVDVDLTGADAPPGARLLDFGDATILPGLVDTHTHLCFDASADPVGRLRAVDDETVYDDVRKAARTALSAGITTVRDLGDRSYLAVRFGRDVTHDPTLGPDVVASGPPLTAPNEHCWYLGGVAHTVDAVRAAVADHVAAGARVIKVMATGGLLTPGTSLEHLTYPLELMHAAAGEAHRQGVPITAHAHGRAGIVGALDAGFDGVEHATFLTAQGFEPDPAVIDRLARTGTVVSSAIPRSDVPMPADVATLVAQGVAVAAALVNAGVRIVLGPDAGVAPYRPHDSLPIDIVAITQVMSTLDALAAATRHAADACGLGDRKGRIVPGYDADVLVVAGDPVADISTITRPLAVFHRGVPVSLTADPAEPLTSARSGSAGPST